MPSKLQTIGDEETVSRPRTAASGRPKSSSVAFGRSTTQQTSVMSGPTEDVDKENTNSVNHIEMEDQATASIEKHKDFGKVPHYIEKIRSEMKMTEEKREEQRAKARMPPGTRLMTENERI